MIDYIFSLSVQPAWIFVAIILASYVLEDVAIISAAMIAADQIIPVELAFYAILIGIISGDIGLYLLGYWLKNMRLLQKYLDKKNRQEYYKTFFNSNLIKNILFIRFVPGLRFICYTSCGLFRAHLGHFILGVSLAGAVWVMLVFTLVYQLGTSAWLEYSEWKWLLIPISLGVLILSNRQIMQRIQQQENIA